MLQRYVQRLACSVRIIYLRAKKLPVIRALRKSCSVHSGLSSCSCGWQCDYKSWNGNSYCVCTRACQILHRRCHSRAYSTGAGILIQRSANNHIISIITKEVTHQPHGARPLLCLHLKRTFEACYCRAYFICCSCFMIICLTISPPIEPACLEVRSPL